MTLSINPPFPTFQDVDGKPLENGYIWVGAENLDPQSNPIAVYWDAALTQAAAQPIRTNGGYPVNAGTPATIYAVAAYSIRVMDKKGRIVYSSPSETLFLDSSRVRFLQSGAGATSRTLQDKGRETISVKDFGAVGDWNGTQSSPGAGTDDTAAIQAAINECVAKGARLFFPPGRYRTTAPLVIDRSFNTEDPINGGMFGIAIEGASAASCQIASDHNGKCIEFLGGAGAGWHTYFNMNGIGLLKANYARNAGSVGLSLDQCGFFSINRFDFSCFEHGAFGTDCLSGSFGDGTFRLNNHGFRFEKGTRSHPNNITFRAVTVLNNQITGGTLIKPSVFSFFGGSIESNGYTGTIADPSSWGLYVEQAGAEGSVGVTMHGTYIENNNGIADVWIVSTGVTSATTAIHNFSGCSFLRFLNTRYVTNNIRLDGANPSKLSISGCGFKDYTPYVSDASRLWVGAGNSQVFDGGGNLFYDTAGGFVGMNRAVFAPINTHHQIQFSALPSASEFRNGIQYCSDGSGSSLPSLAVSNGISWFQVVLGQYAGRVSSAGSALRLPRGWTSSKTGVGVYLITHNLNLAANTYSVVASPSGAPGRGYSSGKALSGNTFELYFANTAGAGTDMDFDFQMSIV